MISCDSAMKTKYHPQYALKPVIRILCALTIVGLILTLLFSSIDMHQSHHHNHHDEICSTCYHISTTQNILRLLSVYRFISLLFLLSCALSFAAILPHYIHIPGISLVDKKIKLTN